MLALKCYRPYKKNKLYSTLGHSFTVILKKTCEKEDMNSRIFTLNSHVMKSILQTLIWFNLRSEEIDVNPSAELEVNSGEEKEVKHS